MKKLIMALVCLVMFTNANAQADCYEKLLKGGIDSVVHQMNVSDESPSMSIRSMAITGLRKLLRSCGCGTRLKRVQCGEAIKGNNLTKICYVESDWGYFLVNRDYLDNLNIIFNRWD